MIEIDSSDLEAVRRIVDQFLPDCEVPVLGSRVRGTAHRYSDLDLALRCPKSVAPSSWRA